MGDLVEIPERVVTLKLDGNYEGVEVNIVANPVLGNLIAAGKDIIMTLTLILRGGNFATKEGNSFPIQATKEDIEKNIPFDMAQQIMERYNIEVLGLPKNLSTT